MNKRIDFTNLGGLPVDQDTLAFMQASYRDALGALANLCGNKTILFGVETVGGNTSNGWIVVDGELMPFIGGATGTGVVITETSVSLPFDDGQSRAVEFTKIAQFGTPQTFAFSELTRIGTLKQMRADLTDAIDDIANHTHTFASLTENPFKGFGSFDLGNVPASDGYYTINFPVAQPDANYRIIGTMRGKNSNLDFDNDVSWVVGKFTTAGFELGVREYVPAAQNLAFDYMIIRF